MQKESKTQPAFSIVDAASASVHGRSAAAAKAASSDKTAAQIAMHMAGGRAPVNAKLVKSRFTTGAASRSFTSTSYDPVTKMNLSGDPTGTGRGGEYIWGKPFKDELNSKLLHSGRVAGGLTTLSAMEKVPVDDNDRPLDKVGSWYSNPGTGTAESGAVGGGGVGKYLLARNTQSESASVDTNLTAISVTKKRKVMEREFKDFSAW
ncbi:hypothetical protein CRYUN_Cryun24cG0052800 [Craigia yunnanensis]